MFKLLKRLMLIGIVAGGTVYAVKHTKVGSHVRHEAEEAVAWADRQVPVERKISKLRKDVAYLNKDIDQTASKLAKEIVECRMLTQEVTEQRAGLEKQRAAVLAHGKAIDEAFRVGGDDSKPVPSPDAKARLRAQVASVKEQQQQVNTKERVLELKEKNKANLETQLSTLKTKKLEMETAISAAETKFKELQLAQMESKFQTDDTRLAQIKADLRELNKILDIKAEELKLQPQLHEETTPTTPADGQSVEDILAPLTGSK